MKIGLEFEGVIRNRQTCEIARWSKIDTESQRRIKKLLYTNRCRESVDPCDRYDALAEVRTPPIVNPTAEKLVTALFTEMELATQSFNANGYDIQWWEQPIPEKLHEEIKQEFADGDPEGKKNKLTYTIKDGLPVKYESEGNLFRGGGLHINISSIPSIYAAGLAIELHRRLLSERGYKFESHYRTNLLYRTRYDGKNSYDYDEPIFEYMSHGFNIRSLKDWQKEFSNYQNKGHSHPPQYAWAVILMRHLTNFINDAGKIK